MKKSQLIAQVIGIIILGTAMGTPVHAAEEMEVTYTEPSEYEISIPSSVTLASEADTNTAITASKMNISPRSRVLVKVTSGINAGKVTLTRTDASDTTSSTVSLTPGGSGIDVNDTVAEFRNQTITPSYGGSLYFTGLESNLKAGTWAGELVFTISVQQDPN